MDMRHGISSLIGALALLAPSLAGADPFSVEYRIDLKAFKSGTTAEDALTFALHDDPSCASEVHTAGLFANDPSVAFESPKALKPKGGSAAAKVVLLRALLDVPAPSIDAPLYLTVTGEGITPVGGACQVQLSAVVGPEGAQGADGPQGPQGDRRAPGRDRGHGRDRTAGRHRAPGRCGPAGSHGRDGGDGGDRSAGRHRGAGPGRGCSPPAPNAVFGSGPITHYSGARFVLEATGSATLQLRTTASGFLNYGITYPTSCGAGTSGVGQVFRFSTAVGETLSAPLCDPGSAIFINVYDLSGSDPTGSAAGARRATTTCASASCPALGEGALAPADHRRR